MLFTALNNQFWSTDFNAPMANLPVVIFQFAMSPYADWQTLAWGGAFLITVAVLFLNIGARTLAAWSTFKHDPCAAALAQIGRRHHPATIDARAHIAASLLRPQSRRCGRSPRPGRTRSQHPQSSTFFYGEPKR